MEPHRRAVPPALRASGSGGHVGAVRAQRESKANAELLPSAASSGLPAAAAVMASRMYCCPATSSAGGHRQGVTPLSVPQSRLLAHAPEQTTTLAHGARKPRPASATSTRENGGARNDPQQPAASYTKANLPAGRLRPSSAGVQRSSGAGVASADATLRTEN